MSLEQEPRTERKWTPMPQGGKRCGMDRDDGMGDWFVSYSPRNCNSNSEGSWDHWVSLAIQILQHPATGIVRPEARAAVKDVDPKHFYSESGVDLTDEQVAELFPDTGRSS